MKNPDAEYLRGFYEGCEFVQAMAKRAIGDARRWYDESIFPPRPPGPHSEVYDGEAAAVARLTCDNVLREFDTLYNEEPVRGSFSENTKGE